MAGENLFNLLAQGAELFERAFRMMRPAGNAAPPRADENTRTSLSPERMLQVAQRLFDVIEPLRGRR